jgi:uncharacterized protein
VTEGITPMNIGALLPEQLRAIVEAFPADITFVDADNIVRYFSAYRIFSRPESCLGRDVVECHLPPSRPGVSQLLSEFATGWRDEAYFLEHKEGREVHVRYLALRNTESGYMGCLEIVQWGDEFG